MRIYTALCWLFFLQALTVRCQFVVVYFFSFIISLFFSVSLSDFHFLKAHIGNRSFVFRLSSSYVSPTYVAHIYIENKSSKKRTIAKKQRQESARKKIEERNNRATSATSFSSLFCIFFLFCSNTFRSRRFPRSLSFFFAY